MIQVTHEQLISCLRQYADELAAMPIGNRVEAYRVGGCNERLFECGLWIRAEVTEEQCLSRGTSGEFEGNGAVMEHEDLVRRLDVPIEAIYKLSCTGCCLHVVLDDGNWQREHVQFCMDSAEHGICREVGELLLRLDDNERRLRLKTTGFLDFKTDLFTLMEIA